jgi:hypothetical protein
MIVGLVSHDQRFLLSSSNNLIAMRFASVPFILVIAVLLLPAVVLAQTTFTVTNTNDSGTGSLRKAIQDANASTGDVVIAFNISGTGPHTIQPRSALPYISGSVMMDGLTQPEADCSTWPPALMIEIDGSLAGANASGLAFGGQASGSTVRGLVIHSFGANGIVTDTDDNIIACNFIGTDPSGMQAMGNETGVFITSNSGNRIGGTSASQRNLISGNRFVGIEVDGSSASDNVIQGNYIGTDVTGQGALGNENDGVLIDRATFTTIGGTTAEARNVISGNGDDGIDVFGAEAFFNTIQHNYIGVAADGMTGLGNAEDGIDLNDQAWRTEIKDNVIAANADWGIFINSGARESTLTRNFIGTNSAGAALGNTLGGILAEDSGPQIIGGTYNTEGVCCEGNTIAFNGGPGIGVNADESVSFEKGIRGNRIYANAGLGIDLQLDGVTDNDPLDQDGGSQANRLQNFPVLSPPVTGSLEIAGMLPSRPNAFFRIDVYANDACDPSGYGEGQDFIGTTSVETNSTGDVDFTLELEEAVVPGTFFSATAIDGDGNTSEFAACVAVVNAAPTAPEITSPEAGAEITVGGAPGEPPANPAETFTVAWSAATDPEEDDLTYTWQMAATEDFATVLLSEDTGTETQFETTLGTLSALLDAAGIELGASVTLYHRVVVSDGMNETTGPVVAVMLVRGTFVATEDEAGVPESFALVGNYPNPFNPQTMIGFALPQSAQVRLVVYDMLGREVARLLEGTLSAGRHEVVFDASGLPTGVYLYRLEADGFVQTRRMLLIK